MRQSLAAFPEADQRMQTYGVYTNASMAATFVVETERWGTAAQFLPAPPTPAPNPPAPADANPYQTFANLVQAPAVFARGLADAMQGAATAQQSIEVLRAMRGQLPGTGEVFGMPLSTILDIQALEIAAAASAARGRLADAISTMQQAIALEAQMPPPLGPPPVLKPAHELYGEILLRADRPAEAAAQFAVALFRHPKRARAVLGAARAADRSGHHAEAARAYTQFLQQCHQGDAPLPALREAREYLQQTEAQQITNSTPDR